MIYIAHAAHGNHLNLDILEPHGERTYVFGRWDSPANDPAAMMVKAREVLKDFDFAEDYFVSVGGDPLAAAMCMIALTDMSIDKSAGGFNWLRYERPRPAIDDRPEVLARYTPVHVRFDPAAAEAEGT